MFGVQETETQVAVCFVCKLLFFPTSKQERTYKCSKCTIVLRFSYIR